MRKEYDDSFWIAKDTLGRCSKYNSLLDHLRTFGCTAYVRVDPEKSNKLDTEVVRCNFIGYGFDIFEYKFRDDKNIKILRHYT